jgi:hypothetical protein
MLDHARRLSPAWSAIIWIGSTEGGVSLPEECARVSVMTTAGGYGLAGFLQVVDNPTKGPRLGREQVNLRGNTP